MTFLAILFYMSHVAYLQKSYLLNMLLSFQYVIVFCIGWFFSAPSFFFFEVGYIANFACFYLTHHFVT
jgi:hypothetical protein